MTMAITWVRLAAAEQPPSAERGKKPGALAVGTWMTRHMISNVDKQHNSKPAVNVQSECVRVPSQKQSYFSCC